MNSAVPYTVIRSIPARQDIRQFGRYLKQEAGVVIAQKYLAALEHDIQTVLASNPNAFSWFHGTGEPYRAKLFRLARAAYWIIYVVDDARQRVEIVRFWHAAREPGTHGL